MPYLNRYQYNPSGPITLITPINKDGDRNDPSNCRPISILPAMSKILEQLIHSQLYQHIDQHNILSEAQFRFRKRHSTSTCILSLVDTMYKNVDQNKLTGTVFLGLKKAFDTVDHNILLTK